MKYKSTRGGVSGLGFLEAVMTGLAPDGGLLIPETIPDVSAKLGDWEGLSYTDLATEIIALFSDDLDKAVLRDLVERSYASFDHPAVTPLVEVGNFHVLELFHGPTLAFKDVALQLLGNLFSHVLERDGGRLNILGATSGDTGSAAIAGVRGKPHINIFVMFPEGRTSPVQELQMTTVLDDNVHNLAIEGSFDDCQSILKDTFNDLEFKSSYQLGAVNSVNWARVLAQIVYYFSAWYSLKCPDQFDVAVPTGNFGNIFAGFMARKMGLPIRRLILASNANDILVRFFSTGRYERGDVNFTYSPAMDIQVSSNFERYLFYQFDGSAEKVAEFMESFQATGSARVDFNTRAFDDSFTAASVSDAETLAMIQRGVDEFDYAMDPHTAVGVKVGLDNQTDVPLVCLSTAHPAKFEDAMQQALPDVDTSHPALDALKGLPVRKQLLPADPEAVKQVIMNNVG